MPRPIDTIHTEDGEEIHLPLKWVICFTCRGNGKHSLAVDGHGITQEERERDWDDESWQDYLDGRYDQTCTDCHGTGKVQVADEERLTPEQLKLYHEALQDEAEYRQQCEMERRMGA